MDILPSVLRPFPSLGLLSDQDLVALSKVLKQASYRLGAQICREGDLGDACFFLLSGQVEVTKRLSDGRQVFLAQLEAGTIFGQGGLVPEQTRSADVRATSNVQVLFLRQMDHSWGLNHSMNWAIHLQQLICVHVIRQLRDALGRLGGLAGKNQDPMDFQSRGNTSEGAAATSGMSTAIAMGRTVTREVSSVSDLIEPLPGPRIESHDASTTGRLLTLMAETEASLADGGINLNDVKFVVDAESARRNRTRKQ